MTARCHDVARLLSSGADPAGSDLADHLAACPRCAAWAESVAALDATWAATRPAEPPAAAFDRAWARAATTPAVLPLRSAAGRFPVRALAAAASVLLGLGLGWRLWHGGADSGRDVPPAPVPPASLTPVAFKFEAEPGETLILHIGPDGRVEADTQDLAGTSETITVAAEFEILNFMESQAADSL